MIQLANSTAQPPRDHSIGDQSAEVSVVEYGDYACSDCRRLHEILRRLFAKEEFSIQYVFRHLPLGSESDNCMERAVAAEAAARQDRFWEMHEALFEQSEKDHIDIEQAAAVAGLDGRRFELDRTDPEIRNEISADIELARSEGIERVPTLFIRGKEYVGAWDVESIEEAIRPPVANRVKEIAVEFADWAAASGAMLIVFAIIALAWHNSPLGEAYEQIWQLETGFSVAGRSLVMSLHHWVNDFLMAIFFLIVGLELKRELLSGELSSFRKAAFPAAAAIGGMLVPATIYLAFNMGTESSAGWGVPMATDIAFTLGVLALLGSRVPTSMKVFATALAIVDDLGAILVLAVAYSHGISWTAIGVAAALLIILLGFNRARVYLLWPYLFIGLMLWVAVHFSGLHATLAGVLVAATIPTREKASLRPLLAQEAVGVRQSMRQIGLDREREEEERRRLATRMQVIERRLNPPAERLEHALQPWSSYFVLPIFALANAGIVISLQSTSLLSPASLGIIIGLVLGKPLGIGLGAWLAFRCKLGEKPDGASWKQIIGVAWLCGIGFTMSIFISSEAFEDAEQLTAAKLAVMIGSIVSAVAGILWLRFACADSESERPPGYHS